MPRPILYYFENRADMSSPYDCLHGQLVSYGSGFTLHLKDPFSRNTESLFTLKFKPQLSLDNHLSQLFQKKWFKVAVSNSLNSHTWGYVKLKPFIHQYNLQIRSESPQLIAHKINDLLMTTILNKSPLEIGLVHLGFSLSDYQKFLEPKYQFIEYLIPPLEKFIPQIKNLLDTTASLRVESFQTYANPLLSFYSQTDPIAHQALTHLFDLFIQVLRRDESYLNETSVAQESIRYKIAAVKRYLHPIPLEELLLAVFPQSPSTVSRKCLLKKLLGLEASCGDFELEMCYLTHLQKLEKVLQLSDSGTRLYDGALSVFTILENLYEYRDQAPSDRFSKTFDDLFLRAEVKYRLGLEEDDFSLALGLSNLEHSEAKSVAKMLLQKILNITTTSELVLKLLTKKYLSLLEEPKEILSPSFSIACDLIKYLDKQASVWNTERLCFSNPFLFINPIESIPEADLTTRAERQSNPYSITATLGFWMHAYYRYFHSVPFDPFEFFELFAPIVTHRLAPSLNIFLARLCEIKDYSISFYAQDITSTLVQALTLACKNQEFRDEFFQVIEEASVSCSDRVAWAFNNISLLHKLYETPLHKLEDLKNLLISKERKQLLEKWALADSQTRFDKFGQILDQIEVSLFYFTRLKESLRLYGSIRTMHFPSMAEVNQQHLNEAESFVMSLTSTPQQIFSILTSHPLWISRLQQAYKEEFLALAERISEEISQLMDNHELNFQTCKDLIDNRQLEYELAVTALIEEKTRELLNLT